MTAARSPLVGTEGAECPGTFLSFKQIACLPRTQFFRQISAGHPAAAGLELSLGNQGGEAQLSNLKDLLFVSAGGSSIPQGRESIQVCLSEWHGSWALRIES